MSLRKRLHIAMILWLVGCYFATFVVLIAFHSHHTLFPSDIKVQSTSAKTSSADHPDSCIVCSRIASNQPFISFVSVTSASENVEISAYVHLDIIYSSDFFTQSSGRDPPSNSL
jgi:hypothetical protein